MNKIILIVLIFSNLIAKAQDNNSWIAFWNNDTTLIGFKDKDGEIKIEPKFVGFTMARKFDDIIAVIEDDNGTYKKYYLTKSGKEVGIDSLFVFDNASDCESEGYIRFKDNENEMVGMFDENGNVTIPAEYNALSRVENGLIVALKGAKKKYWDKHIESGCNHYSWKGGKEYLINTNNKILVENFEYNRYLNFFSLKIESKPAKESIRKEFKGLNGQFYSFIDYEKEFTNMINSFLISAFTQEDLKKICNDSIYYWKDGNGWISETKEKFIRRNFELIKNRLLLLISENSDYNIFVHGLNQFIYEGSNFEKYFNNCGEAKESKYPVMNVVINSKIEGELVQDHFDFLKTDNGYRLISLTIGTGKIE